MRPRLRLHEIITPESLAFSAKDPTMRVGENFEGGSEGVVGRSPLRQQETQSGVPDRAPPGRASPDRASPDRASFEQEQREGERGLLPSPPEEPVKWVESLNDASSDTHCSLINPSNKDSRALSHQLRTPTTAALLLLERARIRLQKVRPLFCSLFEEERFQSHRDQIDQDWEALADSLEGGLRHLEALRQILEDWSERQNPRRFVVAGESEQMNLKDVLGWSDPQQDSGLNRVEGADFTTGGNISGEDLDRR